MKKFKLMMYFVNAILLIGVAITSVFAWYTNVTKKGKINANTAELAFNYYFDDSQTTQNSNTYVIDDLVFFDKDSASEGKFFNTMVRIIPITITNASDCALEYSIAFTNTVITKDKYDKLSYDATYDSSKIYYTKAANAYTFTEATVTSATFDNLRKTLYLKDETADVYASKAYADGFFSTSSSISIASGSIEDYISTNSLSKNMAYSGTGTNNFIIDVDGEITLYLYVFGVQEIDTATNEMFINDTYSFTITIETVSNDVDPNATEVVEATGTN